MELHSLKVFLTVAQETYDAYAALEAARKKLKELEAA